MNSTMHWLTAGFDGLVSFIPNLIAGLVILLVGYIIARVLARVTRPLLRRVGFDRFLARLGIVDRDDAHAGSRWGGSIVFAVVMIATLMQVARAWNLTFVATGLARVIAYLPHLFAAAVIFGAALFFANWVRDRIVQRGAVQPSGTPAVGQRPLVAAAVRAGILAIGAFMALRELQIASEIVNIAFTLTLGAIAVAAAIAFGFGSRNVAAQMTQEWYDRRGSYNGRRDVGAPRTSSVESPRSSGPLP